MDAISPGVEKETALRQAGFNDTEIDQWKSDTARDLNQAGFASTEIDDYFGQKNPDMASTKKALKANMDQAAATEAAKTPTQPGPKQAKSFDDAIQAGWQMSVSGLIKRGQKPDVVLPEDAPMFYRIASQVSGLAGDVPAMIAGGAAAGAAAAPAAAAAGVATGGVAAPIVEGAAVGYGSFALPTAIRHVLMDHYEKGNVKDFNDFWSRAAATFIDANKSGMIGAATAGVGGVVGKTALGLGAGAAVKTTAQLTSEVATMTTLGKAVEGETPQPQDFIDAAILVGGMHGAGFVASKLRNTYAKTGVAPSEVALRAQTDPLVRQDLVTQQLQVPDKIAQEKGIPIGGEQIGAIGGSTNKEVTGAPIERSEAQTKILSQVGEKVAPEGEKYSARTAYKDFVDKLDPIHEAEKILTENPKTVPTDQSPYQLARMANDYKSKVKFVIEKGGLDYETLGQTGKSLQEIIAPFKKDPEGFEAYLISKRAIEVEGKNLKSGFDLEAAKKVVAEGTDKYEGAAQDFYKFENTNLKYLKDSGVISDKEFTNMTEMNKAHTSFARILDTEKGGDTSGGGAKGPGSLKEFKGSDLKIQSPLISTLENTQSIFRVAEKNRAVSALIDMANESKDQKLLTLAKNPKARLGDNQFEVYRNGEREVWESSDKNLAEAVKSLGGDTTSTNVFLKIAKTISGVKRLSISLAPDFIVKNFFRDQLTAGSFSKGGSYPFFDSLVAMKDLIGKNDNYYNWLKSGGAGGSFLELNKNYLEQNIFDLNRQTGLIDKAWNVVKKPVHFLEAAGALAEQATRLAEFKRVTMGETEGSKIFQGGFAAREVTVDFTRIGAKMSALNSITAFQNVSIQGLDRAVRAIKENPKAVLMKSVASITVPSVLLWWANKDDERYKQIPRWQKDTFWIIPTDNWQEAKAGEADNLPDYLIRQNGGKTEINKGVIYRVPKPQELGILFGSLPERALEKYFTDNPNATKDFDKTMQNLVTPSMVPDSIAPFIEQKYNKGIFNDSKVVPGYLEGVAPEYQYTEYTSESAKQLAKMIKFIPGVGSDPSSLSISSPAVIDNYARSWSGNLGMYTLRIADEALYKTGVVPEPVKPASTLADIPVIKAFVIRNPSASATSIQDFYDNYAIQKQHFDTIQHLGKTQDFENLQKELDKLAGGDDVFMKLDGMKKALTTQSQVIRVINKNPDYTPDEKRQLIDGIYYGMIEITKAGNDILTGIEKANKELKKGKTNE